MHGLDVSIFEKLLFLLRFELEFNTFCFKI